MIRLWLLGVVMACTGCSLRVGAGAAARIGRRPAEPRLSCDGFETCDAAYQRAVARARSCDAADSDCESEEADVAATYQELREQTYRELDALRRGEQHAARELAAVRRDCPAPAPAAK